GDDLGAILVQVVDQAAAGGEAADDAVEVARLLVEVLHAPGDGLADDVLGGDRRLLGEEVELKAEQPRQLLAAGETCQKQHVLAQRRGHGEETSVLSVTGHERLPCKMTGIPGARERRRSAVTGRRGPAAGDAPPFRPAAAGPNSISPNGSA